MKFALYEWSTTILLVVLTSTIAAEVAQNRAVALKTLVVLGTIGCSLYVFNTLVAYISMLSLGIQAHPNDLIIGFDNYRFFNHIQTVSLPLLALLALRSGSISSDLYRYRYGLRILISCWWMLLFVTGGRGTFLGLFVGIFIALFLFRHHAIKWCCHMLIGAMVGLAASWVLYTCVPLFLGLQPFGLLGNVATRTVENVDSSRMPLWRLAIEMTMAQPWLGAGPLHFAHVGRFQQIAAHPHNWILQIASEWGIPALICFSGLIFLGLRHLIRVSRLPNANRADCLTILVALLATGIAIVVDGLVSGLLVTPSSQLWIALYVGFSWGWTEGFNRSITASVKPKIISSLTFGFVTGFLVLLLALVAYGLWPAVLNLPNYEKGNDQYQTNRSDGHLSPRIWRHGFF
ncbi:O-antigen ligase family protein [Polaromonas sp. CG_9.5]|uniref:O-antigen ligase family protein n=1 Tax=Polaromonas sp. CG_9.5 TaxID=3071705 RepID=UPI002E0E073F